VILKTVPKAGFDVYTGKINQDQRSKDGNREENLEKNSAAPSGTMFRISRCSQRSKLKLLLTFLF
jgi:hypothetical protein